MSIQTFNIEADTQDLKVNPEMKLLYGEIFTPFSLIEKMFSLFPSEVFSNPDKKWLDSGAGTGFFSMFLYKKLDRGLKKQFPRARIRHNHIIKNMIYMVEIRDENIAKLKTVFGKHANIYHQNFLSDFHFPMFDYVIGNPPYNSNGMKKVPTNKLKKKKQDGQTIWLDFIKRAISLLKQNGRLLYIVPSLWMKPDKAMAYDYITQFKLHKICCLTNTETNKYFNREAQTPTCYFTLEKTDTDYQVLLYDNQRDKFINHKIENKGAIPLFAASVIQKLIKYVDKVGTIYIIKTNMPKKKSLFSQKPLKCYNYKNIKTCILNKLAPELVINYSNVKQAYADQPKLVLAHKMYGFPYVDELGEFGISNRDNYVIVERNVEELKILREFFSTKTALYIFEATRYRMKYLEKYAFEFIPDVTRLHDFPKVINDTTIAEYFGFDEIDKKNIQDYHKKPYNFNFNSIEINSY
tara:strand:+ start:72 stop:1466 length:1395 start_codon:yes stop_codon:yes gene_type:complete